MTDALVEVPASSPLASLREQIAAARAAKTKDLEVPDLPGVVVRVRALGFAELDKATKPDDSLIANAHVVATATVGIFRREGGRLVDIRPDGAAYVDDSGRVVGTPATFNVGLEELFGDDITTVAGRVCELFVLDGHVIAAGNAVVDLSGVGYDFAESLGKA